MGKWTVRVVPQYFRACVLFQQREIQVSKSGSSVQYQYYFIFYVLISHHQRWLQTGGPKATRVRVPHNRGPFRGVIKRNKVSHKEPRLYGVTLRAYEQDRRTMSKEVDVESSHIKARIRALPLPLMKFVLGCGLAGMAWIWIQGDQSMATNFVADSSFLAKQVWAFYSRLQVCILTIDFPKIQDGQQTPDWFSAV